LAINKANTPLSTKIVLIILIIAFAMSFVSVGAGLFSCSSDTGGQEQQDPDVAAVEDDNAINANYQSMVEMYEAKLQSDPEDYQTLVSLGNTYFDWADGVSKAADTASDVAQMLVGKSLWEASADAYARALKVRSDEAPVWVDYSTALFYSEETTQAIEAALAASKADPEFASAWYNLGIYYENSGQNDLAVEAYKKAVATDPSGAQIDLVHAKQKIAQSESGD